MNLILSISTGKCVQVYVCLNTRSSKDSWMIFITFSFLYPWEEKSNTPHLPFPVECVVLLTSSAEIRRDNVCVCVNVWLRLLNTHIAVYVFIYSHLITWLWCRIRFYCLLPWRRPAWAVNKFGLGGVVTLIREHKHTHTRTHTHTLKKGRTVSCLNAEVSCMYRYLGVWVCVCACVWDGVQTICPCVCVCRCWDTLA